MGYGICNYLYMCNKMRNTAYCSLSTSSILRDLTVSMNIYANLVEATQRYRMTIAIENTYFITMSAMAVLGNLWVKLVKIG